jgi:hypothetical protein
MLTTLFPMLVRRRSVAACVGAATFLVASASYGQAPGNAEQSPAPVNPQSLSCTDLKAQLHGAGELRILSGPKEGWGDTFYGPAVPRCEFWQMPRFTYVRARDGLCGVGYICIDKYSSMD